MLKLIRGLINIPSNFPGCVATIGNFDGVHLGHQALITQLLQKSRELDLPAVLITFEPQPNEFFAKKDSVPARLMRLREKWFALRAFSLDYLLCLRFDKKMSDLSPALFIQKILVEKLKIAHILIGDDFRFGSHRAGNIATLREEGLRWHFTADNMDTYKMMEDRVSSSLVRLALEKGDLASTRTLLGRSYGISGRVAHGHKRGRIIGFPTANVFLHRKTVPINGVYAVTIHGLGPDILQGVANIGTRPTIDGTHSLLEVHIFDFNRDIYGQHIFVEFVKKLRDEKRYDSFELLRQQILKDADEAKDYFKHRS